MSRNLESRSERVESQKSPEVSSKLPEGTAEQAKKLTPAKRRDYYKKIGLDNLANNEAAISAQHKSPGPSYRSAKINSDNFKKIADARGLHGEDRKNLKESFAKWSKEAQNNEKLRQGITEAKHAKKGDKYLITDDGPKNHASGIYVSKKSLGKTPEERIQKGALPGGNKATQERPVELGKKQDLIAGTIGPQEKFEGDGIERTGGGKQYITDGGYDKDHRGRDKLDKKGNPTGAVIDVNNRN